MSAERAGFAFAVAIILAGLSANPVSAESLASGTVPNGLTVKRDGTNHAAPITFDCGEGSLHTLDTPGPQVAGDGHSHSVFATWSDGGAQSHSITVPASDTINTVVNFPCRYYRVSLP